MVNLQLDYFISNFFILSIWAFINEITIILLCDSKKARALFLIYVIRKSIYKSKQDKVTFILKTIEKLKDYS